MPATEQTWRDQLRMHAIFGVSSVIMLLATVWMFAKDHAREWKRVQATKSSIDRWTTTAQIAAAESAEYSRNVAAADDALLAAQTAPISSDDVAEFKRKVEAFANTDGMSKPNFASLDAAMASLEKALAEDSDGKNQTAAAARVKVLDELRSFIHEANRMESNRTQALKFEKARQTAIVSEEGLDFAAGGNAEELKPRIEDLKQHVIEMTEAVDAVAVYRKELEGILGRITADEDAANKRIADLQTDVNRLKSKIDTRTDRFIKWLIKMPILDGFYTGADLGVAQIWLPELKIDYNFADVARFDRCITCHQAIDQTKAGSATEPAFEPLHSLVLELATPTDPPAEDQAAGDAARMADAYGILLADRGRVHREDVAIQVVRAESAAAVAGLEMGDVIRKIGDAEIFTKAEVQQQLLELAAWGKPLSLTIERGVPQPFASHPRLDLFVGSQSPHQKMDIGCTICHDGQGSATEFKFASHTPDNPQQARDWYDHYGWFDNHNWLFPMSSERFLESNCLKCHHDVTQLAPSERFPEPPAPKLTKGYETILQFGCYGCHEINGYSKSGTIGPDLRLEPNYYAAAQQLLTDENLSDEERDWAGVLVHAPENDQVRRKLLESLEADRMLAKDDSADTVPRLSSQSHDLADLFKDQENPGQLRRVGPSLRYVASKNSYEFLYGWIRKPSDFRPTTRMPQPFGLFNHLDEDDIAHKYQPVEIRAIAEYLLANSQPFSYADAPSGELAPPSAERGKQLFETRGCLACHSHADFPGIASTKGPDLSRIGGKLAGEKGRRWLYTWLKDPSQYHVRTTMPNLFLDPKVAADGTRTDPAADIVEFLMGSGADWRPENVPPRDELTQEERDSLLALTVENLVGSFSARNRAERYAAEGIPADLRSELKVDDRLLLQDEPGDMVQRQLRYVGRKAIGFYGCSGCHDIPGFEAAKSIGTGLADWGRKESSRLAFEQIHRFLADKGINGDEDHTSDADGAGGGEQHELSPGDFDPDTGYFLSALNSHNRIGFLWQKLRMPRSYDYLKVDTKGYYERLRMPQFPLDSAQREAVMTFVLGLVSEPPARQYIDTPDPRRAAIVAGRKVLTKYNCAGCHFLSQDRWEFSYRPEDLQPPAPRTDYPFLAPFVTAAEVNASLKTDERGMRHADIYGRPEISDATGQLTRYDADEFPLAEGETADNIYRRFTLWRNTVINGTPRESGVDTLFIHDDDVTKYSAHGGDLARYLFPIVVADEKQRNPQVVGGEAWGWLPPSLAGEGLKVQPEWLHDFLLSPYRIRPAAVLRMPKFNMSSAEASALVDYFAATDGAEYPYEFNRRQGQEYLASIEAEQPNRLEQSFQIVVKVCVQCHVVGDFSPEGSERAKGPNLAEVYRRLRPEFVQRWIANPKRILPYTPMPVNIPYDPAAPNLGGIDQAIYSGTSLEQVDGLVDWLMNFDRFTGRQISIKERVPPPEPAAGAAAAESAGAAQAGAGP